MPKFVVLMHEDDHAWSRLPQTERDRLLARYTDWVKELKGRGQFVGGEPLGAGGRVLRSAGGPVRETHFAEDKGVLTGFFLIEAESLNAAAQLARDCPALLHGETLVVRPVGHDE